MFLACAFVCAAAAAAAQNPYMARTGVYEEEGRLVVADPRSVLAVDLTAEEETVLCGPYARYAQKFLGVRAPLTDKSVWTLTGAAIALAESAAGEGTACPAAEQSRKVCSHSRSDEGFARIQPDKTDLATLPLEEAARQAAATIFSLRRHRMELVTGEAGEQVFGAGLGAALTEIERLEQEYLELFLGKRTVAVRTVRCLVNPQEGKKQYIVCRFSPEAGVVPANDLSGDMVLLQIEPSGDTACPFEATRRESQTAAFRIADPSECTVAYGSSVLARAVLPLYEFGRTVEIAVPRKR